MSNLKEYFSTDWTALTLHDWIGLVMTVAAFVLMIWAYVHVFHPKNKAKFEAQRRLPDADADIETEDKQ